jgi:hypothetical protein
MAVEALGLTAVAEEDVVEDGHGAGEHEVLVDHPYAGGEGVVGGAEGLGLAVDEDAAGVGAEQAVEDVHEGGFAGAVFTEEAVDGGGGNGEGDGVEGGDGAEGFVDVEEFDEGSHEGIVMIGIKAASRREIQNPNPEIRTTPWANLRDFSAALG